MRWAPMATGNRSRASGQRRTASRRTISSVPRIETRSERSCCGSGRPSRARRPTGGSCPRPGRPTGPTPRSRGTNPGLAGGDRRARELLAADHGVGRWLRRRTRDDERYSARSRASGRRPDHRSADAQHAGDRSTGTSATAVRAVCTRPPPWSAQAGGGWIRPAGVGRRSTWPASRSGRGRCRPSRRQTLHCGQHLRL